MPEFTPTQGKYLAFIHSYTNLHGRPPAESEIATAMRVMPPSVNQMIRTLEQRGLISRVPGKPRSVQILLPEDEIPVWKRGGVVAPNPKAKKGATKRTGSKSKSNAQTPVELLVLDAILYSGPIGDEFEGKRISRIIEIRADQTLADFHVALFHAFDRNEERPYEFNFGSRRFDPEGKNFGNPKLLKQRNKSLGHKLKSYDGDVREVIMSDLGLVIHKTFGYCFDFENEIEWFHFISLQKREQAIATVEYPRLRRRIGKSPPQYS